MVKLYEIVKKNLKILIRSKSSALIILLGPLLLILLVGSAFNTSSFSEIAIGSYSGSYSELSNSILTKLETDNYKVTRLENSQQCTDGVKSGVVNICIIFPDNLNVESGEEIELYVDQSRANLVFAIKSAILSKVTERSDELSKDLTETIIGQLTQTSAELQLKRDEIINVQQKNSDLRSKVGELESNIINMNVNFSELSLIVSEMENETNELETEYNKSFNALNNLIDSIDAEINSFNALDASRTNALSKISEVNTDLSSSNLQLQTIRDTTDSIITRIEAIAVTDVDSIVSPIKTTTKPISKEETHINYLFPTLIMMVVMFVSILLSSITVIREKTSAAFFRNFISPTNSIVFIFATYLTNILIVILQLAIVFGVMVSFNPALSSTLINISLALLIITTTFILLGMIIGYVFSSEETATIGSISLGTILLFFSNTIIPLETLPTGFRQIANYNIFVIGEAIIRKIILFESSLKGISKELYLLGAYILVFIVVIFVIYRASTELYNIKRHLKGK